MDNTIRYSAASYIVFQFFCEIIPILYRLGIAFFPLSRERKHKCTQCSRAFPTKSKLDSHSKKHHGFVCTLCYPVDLDTCEVPVNMCVWKFDSFIALRRHMALVHPKPCKS